jgi:hypothetical protein
MKLLATKGHGKEITKCKEVLYLMRMNYHNYHEVKVNLESIMYY